MFPIIKKSLFIILSVSFFNSCNSPEPVTNGSTIFVKSGTTSIDDTFFESLDDSDARQDRIAATEANFFAQTGKHLNLQTTITLNQGLNLYVAIDEISSRSGGETIALKLEGPLGKYDNELSYPADAAWQTYAPLFSQGDGEYILRASLNGKTAQRRFTVTHSNTLAVAKNVTVARAENVLLARWNPVEQAKSYFVDFYDNERDVYLGGHVIKEPSLLLTDFPIYASQNSDMTVFALSWDATLPSNKPFPKPLPDFNASLTSSIIPYSSPELIVDHTPILSSPTESTNTVAIKITNGGSGPLIYYASLGDTEEAKISSGEAGSLFYREETEVIISYSCTAETGQENILLTITSNDPTKEVVELNLKAECLNSIESQLKLKLDVKSSPEALLFTPNNKSVFAANSTRIQNVGDGLKYMLIDSEAGITNTEEFAFIFSPVLGWINETSTFMSVHFGDCGPPTYPTCDELKHFTAEGKLIATRTLDTYYMVKKFSPSGQYLALWQGSDNRGIRLIDSQSASYLLTLEGSEELYADNLTWSHDGTKLATASNGVLSIWEAKTGNKTFEKLVKTGEKGCSGAYLYWSTYDQAIHYGNCQVNLETGEIDQTGHNTYDYENGLLSPDGKYLLKYNETQLIIASAFSNTTLAIIDHDLNPQLYSVEALAWSEDSNYIAVGKGINTDPSVGEIYIWSLR